MRPRHKAAENARAALASALGLAPASMRPRHKAAENGCLQGQVLRELAHASMRPRHKAAENLFHFQQAGQGTLSLQ